MFSRTNVVGLVKRPCRRVILTVGAMAVVLTWGCSTAPQAPQEPGCGEGSYPLVVDVITEAQKSVKGNSQRGETLFTSLCSSCHVHGRLSNVAKTIRDATSGGAPVPPHLSCERFQYSNSEAYLAATIKYGGRPEFQAHSMPAWQGVLNDEDVADLVAYIVSIGDITPPN
jgi:mono/diheme cytochrome c family protein